MPNIRRFLSRRWLFTFLGVAVFLFGLVMLHPYPRQSLFGPTIRGKPWCYWEDEVRWIATHQREEAKRGAFEKKARTWLGIERHEMWFRDFDHEEMLPLLLYLANDADKEVQLTATEAIVFNEELYLEPALPILREQLHGEDVVKRMYAAKAIWHITKDKQMVPMIMQVLNTPTKWTYHRGTAMEVLSYIARDLPELFPELVKFAFHEDVSLRCSAMVQMRYFGKQGIPVLLKGLDDREEDVRAAAARMLGRMGADANATVPALQRLLLDENQNVRGAAIDALYAIDRPRFIDLKYPLID